MMSNTKYWFILVCVLIGVFVAFKYYEAATTNRIHLNDYLIQNPSVRIWVDTYKVNKHYLKRYYYAGVVAMSVDLNDTPEYAVVTKKGKDVVLSPTLKVKFTKSCFNYKGNYTFTENTERERRYSMELILLIIIISFLVPRLTAGITRKSVFKRMKGHVKKVRNDWDES